MNKAEMESRESFEMFGFSEEDTGGNCKAWMITYLNGREIMVTDGDGGLVVDLDKPCLLSGFDGYSSEPVFNKKFLSGYGFFDWIGEECEAANGVSAPDYLHDVISA